MAKKTIKKSKLKAKEDSFVPVAKELALAYTRVNSAPARRVRWLLTFSDLDLDNLSEGRLADLRWEVVVFGLNRRPEQMKSEFDMLFDFHFLSMSSTINLRLESIKSEDELKEYQRTQLAERYRGAPLDVVRDFQTTMKEIFRILFSGEQWRFTRPAKEEVIALSHIKPKSGAPWAHNPPAYTAKDLLMIQAIDLIKAEWQRLRACQNPRCNRNPRFVAAKKGRAQFCSAKCSAYVRVNKSRGIDVASMTRDEIAGLDKLGSKLEEVMRRRKIKTKG